MLDDHASVQRGAGFSIGFSSPRRSRSASTPPRNSLVFKRQIPVGASTSGQITATTSSSRLVTRVTALCSAQHHIDVNAMCSLHAARGRLLAPLVRSTLHDAALVSFEVGDVTTEMHLLRPLRYLDPEPSANVAVAEANRAASLHTVQARCPAQSVRLQWILRCPRAWKGNTSRRGEETSRPTTWTACPRPVRV